MSRVDDVCPRCGAAREPDQEYCLECGLELPPTGGALARLRRGWIRAFGWYPGDWVWSTLLALVVAAAGAAAAIAFTTSDAGSATGTTLALTRQPTVTATTAPPPATTTAPPEPTTTARRTTTRPKPTKTTRKPPAPGATPWPAGESGWTVVLESLPATGTGEKRARARAQQAARAGLPEVGVLDSSRYASLHPGYFVVFTGVYDTRAQAQSTLNAAYAAGFSSAYVRQIAD